MRRLILAIQFLTRLPTPDLRDFDPAELPRSAHWFPLIGVLIGAFLCAAMYLGSRIDPWLGALATLLVWIWITGALHLDGLADLTDALGAAHRDRERFLAVLADPHLGTFGVVSLVMQLLTKLVLLMLIARSGQYVALLLIPAWARWGTLIWARLPSLKAGMGERFHWHITPAAIVAWGLLLALLSCTEPLLLCAIALVWLWRRYLLRTLGGMTGDTLGAGVECVESALLWIVIASTPFQTHFNTVF